MDKLVVCPECEAEECINGIRPGPALISISEHQYRVICVSCWHGTKVARTKEKAVENWNKQIVVLGIRKLREQAGLTIKQLSKQTGISETSIKEYERRERTPSKQYKSALAKALDVDVTEI